jgi:hypothetical protein
MRRLFGKVLATLAVVALLAGCTRLVSADPAVERFQAFAVDLDGVINVEAVSVDSAEIGVFDRPIIGAIVSVQLGGDWQNTIRDVATEVGDWLNTQVDRTAVVLQVGITTPFGAIGIADDPLDTTARIRLLTQIADDHSITGASIGYNPFGFVDETNELASVEIARRPDTTVASVISRWGAAVARLAPHGTVGVVVDVDVTDTADPTTTASAVRDATLGGQRRLMADTSISADDALVRWADAVDSLSTVIGWRAESTADHWYDVAVAVADVDSVEPTRTAVSAIPGFHFSSALTVMSPTFSVIDEGEGSDATVALGRELARISGINFVTVQSTFLELGEIDVPTARAVLAAISAHSDVGDLMITASVRVAQPDAYGTHTVSFYALPAGDVAAWLPSILDIPATTHVNAVEITTSSQVYFTFSSDFDITQLRPIFVAIYAQAILNHSQIQAVMADNTDQRFSMEFTARPQLSRSDVSSVTDISHDERYVRATALWNSLAE